MKISTTLELLVGSPPVLESTVLSSKRKSPKQAPPKQRAGQRSSHWNSVRTLRPSRSNVQSIWSRNCFVSHVCTEWCQQPKCRMQCLILHRRRQHLLSQRPIHPCAMHELELLAAKEHRVQGALASYPSKLQNQLGPSHQIKDINFRHADRLPVSLDLNNGGALLMKRLQQKSHLSCWHVSGQQNAKSPAR